MTCWCGLFCGSHDSDSTPSMRKPQGETSFRDKKRASAATKKQMTKSEAGLIGIVFQIGWFGTVRIGFIPTIEFIRESSHWRSVRPSLPLVGQLAMNYCKNSLETIMKHFKSIARTIGYSALCWSKPPPSAETSLIQSKVSQSKRQLKKTMIVWKCPGWEKHPCANCPCM